MFCTFQDGDAESSNRLNHVTKSYFSLVNGLFWGKVVGGELAGNDLELFSQSPLTLTRLILIERSVSAQ